MLDRTPRAVVPLVVWALLVAMLVQMHGGFLLAGSIADPDSNARMMQVADLLGGQGWWDLAQHRFGRPGAGTPMHWTRLADLLPAGLTLLLTPALGRATALFWAQATTPLLLALPLVALAFGTVRALAGRSGDLPLAVVLLSAFGLHALFVPGDVDHHNLQAVAVALLLWGLATARGRVAGVAVALAMTIGLETGPIVLGVLGAVAGRWALAPSPGDRVLLRDLALGMAGGTAAAVALFLPHPLELVHVDGWTVPVALAVLGLAALFGAAVRLEPAAPAARVALLAGGALALALLSLALFPAWRHHPAGEDPLLWRHWMDNVTENAPVWRMAANGELARAVALLGAAPVLLIAGLWAAPRDPRLWPLVGATAAGLAVTLLHVRGQALLASCAGSLAAVLIAQGRGAWRLALLPPVWMVAGAAAQPPHDPRAPPEIDQTRCWAPPVIAALRRLPPTTLALPMSSEPAILWRTPHRSLFASYHRNLGGDRLYLAAMVANGEASRALLHRGGATHLLACPGYPVPAAPAGSLSRALDAGAPPAWLRPIARPLPGIALYRIE